MLFNSIEYALFLPLVFILYWWVNKNLKLQNLLLLVSSYYFYAFWDYRFLFLLIFSTLLDYTTGIKISEAKNQRSKKLWLWLSIAVNVGFLGVFKYYNFFASSFAEAVAHVGFKAEFWTINVILPVGISFYTFHGLSYVLDIYNGKIKPTKNFIDYSVFVSFFPLLVAGPIERATHLLPQIQKKRTFDYAAAVDGLTQILWGIFKKMVIADNCAEYVNLVFKNPSAYSGSTLLVGAILFAFQGYCDFSGYSDIALGSARLLGIKLLRNFAFPFLSRDMAEFWRRYHISLTTWFRDYMYIPLGGSRGSTWIKVRNIFLIFLVSGFWHGANWTFLAWGAINALYFLPLLLLNKNRDNIETVAQGKTYPSMKDLLNMVTTFGLVVFSWIFFRADTIGHAFIFIKRIFTGILHKSVYAETAAFMNMHIKHALPLSIALFILLEWYGREQEHPLARVEKSWSKPKRLALYYLLIAAICFWGATKQQFIYFQF